MLDWKNLSFDFIKTNGYVKLEYKDDSWGEIELVNDTQISIHVIANCLNYGQACFEGLKAFKTKENNIVLFRPYENALRMQNSAVRLCMKSPPVELFVKACKKLVKKNLEFVPPYGTGASLYLRPVLIGTQSTLAVVPSKTYTFFIAATPVGPYYKQGFKPVKSVVIREYDRAAPQGAGMTKMAGNYAAGLAAFKKAKDLGYPIVLYTDPKEHKYVDEFGTSNFFGITNNEYKTPLSDSILPSITNKSLQVLAKDLGLKVVKEKIAVSDLNQFKEVGACGTAAVITPISSVYDKDNDKSYVFGSEERAGEILSKLYNKYQAIKFGDEEDKYNWLEEV